MPLNGFTAETQRVQRKTSIIHRKGRNEKVLQKADTPDNYCLATQGYNNPRSGLTVSGTGITGLV
jgi:K+/H+ antiporter YhaU regulatory subunit KhtT